MQTYLREYRYSHLDLKCCKSIPLLKYPEKDLSQSHLDSRQRNLNQTVEAEKIRKKRCLLLVQMCTISLSLKVQSAICTIFYQSVEAETHQNFKKYKRPGQCKAVQNIVLENLKQQTTITSNFLLKIFFVVVQMAKEVTQSEPPIMSSVLAHRF